MIVGLAFGRVLVVFSCARDVGLFLVLFASPGCGVLLGCFVGCARMRVLGLWVLVCRLSGVFLFRVDAPIPLF